MPWGAIVVGGHQCWSLNEFVVDVGLPTYYRTSGIFRFCCDFLLNVYMSRGKFL